MKVTSVVSNKFVDLEGLNYEQEYNKDRPIVLESAEIDFNSGNNFLVPAKVGTNLSFTAKNQELFKNVGKTGFIMVYTTVSGFSSDFKVINPEFVIASSSTNIYSYFINPVDGKICIKWGGVIS
ncbi:hypothetical protein [Campylobacter fetus]|uniref:Uncharacterized protein n=1 Tax=Campylobacter fetus TaxID=196 RepID=A0A825BG43_CAMFE|nr:hypothetical protein [Campylobacter fetus]OCS22092.1 hypothetical protein CFVI97532_05995 [Campylobacter fetus subsp. venerealis cfvi97/532]OCS40256.1 hypothetical protein CFVI02298_08590 [Campylobacter fetus subsp. venerealis cfvi02/298]EAI3887259.1 hypothetical protein [Campylobacter fetus]EAI8860000.1 hypothetical protein [Campylobacter fetus]EAJ1232779.1 hypothetical protein [Campylobacter fetus]